MTIRLSAITFWVLLALPLVASPLLGLLTPYLALLFIVPLFFVMLARGDFVAAYASYPARIFLAAFIVLAILFAITADAVSDALRTFNFTMLLAFGAIALFFSKRAGEGLAERIAQLAALGVLIGFIEVVASAVLPFPRYLGYDRLTGPNIGPIVLSNALLALGFIALGGALLRRDRRAWLYMSAPVLAITTTLLTGSRGPLIAVPFATLVAGWVLWRYRFGATWRAALIGLGGLAIAAIVGLAVMLKGRTGSIFSVFETLLEGGSVANESARQRLVLYKAGWESFQQSPWIGHGWANIMDSIRPLLPTDDATLAHLPQLHNDVLNFAVGGGFVGVLVYLAIVSAPIVGALRAPRDTLHVFRLYGATVLTIVYIGGGLTDLMFGFEFHTFLFIMLTAILLGVCRDRAPQ